MAGNEEQKKTHYAYKGKRSKFGALSAEEIQALKDSHAQRLIEKFGGIKELSKALNDAANLEGLTKRRWSTNAIYRWVYPVEKGGLGGVVPHQALRLLGKAARLHGIYLTEKDFDHRPRLPKDDFW